MNWDDIARLPKPPLDHRSAYGSDSSQFGELRLPAGAGPFPVAIVIHGGCWRAEYDLDHITPLAAALTARGIATWTIEYRRIGNHGGGWPGTFEDVARASDHVRELAPPHALDLARAVALGHSAGGHIALWVAARGRLPAGSAGSSDALPLCGVVGLAAISDLREFARGASSCMQAARELMGGPPDSLRDRYALADPSELLPFGVPVRLVHGTADTIVPFEQSATFASRASARGDDARVLAVPGGSHFDVIAPAGVASEVIVRATAELLLLG